MGFNVGIFLFNEVEVLDFAGPFEVFSTAVRVRARDMPVEAPIFNVFTVAQQPGMIRARGDLAVSPAFTFGNHPPIDVLIIPGGVVTAELDRAAVVNWISQMARRAKITASVCTGSFLLGQAGLLCHKTATTHWEDLADLGHMFPDTVVKAEARWVDEGHIITSAGISAGIDMSLHLVARLVNEELARRTARQMEYDWRTVGNLGMP